MSPDPASRPGAVLVVDAANVVGARPDGWWRDRVGAAERLLGALGAAVGRGAPELEGRRVVVVLEGRAVAAQSGAWGVDVVRAEGSGDDAVVDLVAGLRADDVLVVTSDRGLRGRVEELGAEIRGAGWLRDVLDG